MQRKPLITALGAAAAAAACGIAVPALNAGPGDYALPDLVSTAPPLSSAYLMEGSFVHNSDGSVEQGAEGRLLLRFDGYVNNEGDGPVDFQGTPKNRNMTQYVAPAGGGDLVAAGVPQPSYGGPLDNQAEHNAACIARAGSAKPLNGPCFIYSTTDSVAASDGHNHWHMVGAAAYSLWNEAGSAEIGDGQKVGFCLQDSEYIPNRGFPLLTPGEKYGEGVPYSMSFCNQGNQSGGNLLREGIHAGYRDLYGSNLAWQWIDVSDVVPGRYRLGGQVDPYNRVWEKNEANPVVRSSGTLSIPGWALATPAAATSPTGQPVTIALNATSYSSGCTKQASGGDDGPCATYTPSAGNRRFVLLSAPASGYVSAGGVRLAQGATFTAPSVRYTPGAKGTFTFRVGVRDSASRYPLNTPGVTASVAVAQASTVPTLVITDVPGSVQTGMQADLGAAVTNGSGAVVWSVNGVDGGDATVGTIDANGVYRAPDVVPAGGTVAVTARLAADDRATDTATLTIVAPVTPEPQPVPVVTPTPAPTPPPGTSSPAPAAPTPGGTVVGTPVVVRMGSRIATGVTPASSGRVVVLVTSRGKVVNRCTFARAVAGRTLWCYTRAGNAPLPAVRVVVSARVRAGTALRLAPTVTRSGTRVVARVRPTTTGRLTVRMRVGRATAKTCVVRRATPRRAVTCAGRMPVGRGSVSVTQRAGRAGVAVSVAVQRARL